MWQAQQLATQPHFSSPFQEERKVQLVRQDRQVQQDLLEQRVLAPLEQLDRLDLQAQQVQRVQLELVPLVLLE
mgnify:CR=1 FL=1